MKRDGSVNMRDFHLEICSSVLMFNWVCYGRRRRRLKRYLYSVLDLLSDLVGPSTTLLAAFMISWWSRFNGVCFMRSMTQMVKP